MNTTFIHVKVLTRIQVTSHSHDIFFVLIKIFKYFMNRMKLAFVTLMSCCLIAVSWQQHYRHQHRHQQANVNPYWPLPLHQQQQQLPYYYQEPHQNYPSYYPYYRGPYISPSAPSHPEYYQPHQQQQVPQRSQLDELKLAALLSQLSQQQQQQGPQQQQENDKQESRQKQLDLDLLNQLNKDSIFIAQHQALDSFADPEAVKQVFSVTNF